MKNKALRRLRYLFSVNGLSIFRNIEEPLSTGGNPENRGFRISRLRAVLQIFLEPGPMRGLMFALVIEAASAIGVLVCAAVIVMAMHLLLGVR